MRTSLDATRGRANTVGRSRKRTLENLAGGDVVLTADELKAIAEVQEKYPVQGDRYFAADSKMAPLAMGLWG